MTYFGHIKNGVAVLDTPEVLPEGTPVRIEVSGGNTESWRENSLDELAQEQGVKPFASLADLTIDWPKDESIDDLMGLVREVRR